MRRLTILFYYLRVNIKVVFTQPVFKKHLFFSFTIEWSWCQQDKNSFTFNHIPDVFSSSSPYLLVLYLSDKAKYRPQHLEAKESTYNVRWHTDTHMRSMRVMQHIAIKHFDFVLSQTVSVDCHYRPSNIVMYFLGYRIKRCQVRT